tara:strand:+ start:130 stop:390 length:261 start_codon:yes stop_codon:yes gene_type:complete
MGKKHNKKRFFCVKYHPKPDKKFDELVTLSKKKIGPTKILEFHVVLDLVNKKVLRADLPGLEHVDYEKISQHYRKYYADTIDEFVK